MKRRIHVISIALSLCLALSAGSGTAVSGPYGSFQSSSGPHTPNQPIMPD
jgi:hypothetical protein